MTIWELLEYFALVAQPAVSGAALYLLACKVITDVREALRSARQNAHSREDSHHGLG